VVVLAVLCMNQKSIWRSPLVVDIFFATALFVLFDLFVVLFVLIVRFVVGFHRSEAKFFGANIQITSETKTRTRRRRRTYNEDEAGRTQGGA